MHVEMPKLDEVAQVQAALYGVSFPKRRGIKGQIPKHIGSSSTAIRISLRMPQPSILSACPLSLHVVRKPLIPSRGLVRVGR